MEILDCILRKEIVKIQIFLQRDQGPLKKQQGARMNFHIPTTDFYVQKYRDLTLIIKN